MATPLSDLEPGDAVLLRFESKFNRDRTQTVVGVVNDSRNVTSSVWAEITLEDEDGDVFLVTWDGGVSRLNQESGDMDYGFNGRLWKLDPVDPFDDELRDLAEEDELHQNDLRPVDPLLDTVRMRMSAGGNIVYRDESPEEA